MTKTAHYILCAMLIAGCARVTPIAHGARTDPAALPAVSCAMDKAERATVAACGDFGAKVGEVSGDAPRVVKAATEGEDAVSIVVELWKDRGWVITDVRVVAPSLPWPEQQRDVRFLVDAIAEHVRRDP